MLHCNRFLRRCVLCLLGMICGVCAAQQGNQFQNQLSPTSTSTGSSASPVTSFLTGSLQGPTSTAVDILYIDSPTTGLVNPPSASAVLAGEELNGAGGLSDLGLDQIPFTGATKVVAALAGFTGNQITDYAFAISGVSTDNLCVYYGTGAPIASGMSSFGYGGNVYPPAANGDSCTTLPVPPQVGNPPDFTYIAALPFNSAGSPQLVVEDSANDLLYVVAVGGTAGLTIKSTIPISSTDGPGPIYNGGFDSNGNNYFIVNGQTGNTATVYIGNGTGGFTAQTPLNFGGHIYSMLIQDMDGDGIADMVVEGDNGAISIYKGNGNGTFQTASEGGTVAGNSLTGNGGHLAAIDPKTLDILTATPIGLSVLKPQSPGSLSYSLYHIYNIGPGRSSFALANFRGGGVLDLAVNSPEGVAIAQGDNNGDGGFQTSFAYSVLAPALSATVGQFRNSIYNPSGILDVVAATGAAQAQLLLGNGIGGSTFTAAPTSTNLSGGPSGIPPGLWSNILSGDFNGDGNLDLAYSLTGLPPLPASGTGLYVQYGKGEGTFQPPAPVTAAVTTANTLYGDSAVGFFDNTGIADIANTDEYFDDALLGQSPDGFNVGFYVGFTNRPYNQVAAGYFKAVAGQTGNQDLVFTQNSQSSLVPYKNTGDGTGDHFTAEPALGGIPVASTDLVVSALLLTDIDGDGNGDVVAIYHNRASNPADPSAGTANWLYIWWGNGDGTFSETPYTLQLSRNYYMAAVADMNGDGLPDIVLSDGYLVGILYNQGALSTPANRSFGVEQQFLAGQGINSLSLVKLNGAITPSLIVANGGATISNPLVLSALGQTSPTPNPPDENTGGITVLANNITTLPVTGTLASSPNPSDYGATFTIAATLQSATGAAEPTGTVTFYIDGGAVTACSYVPLAQGTTSSTAQCVVPVGNTYPIGTHTLTASYGGDNVNSPATLQAPTPQTIVGGPTATVLYLCVGPTMSCPSTGALSIPPSFPTSLPMIYGQTFNGTASVTASTSSPLLGDTVFYDTYNGTPLPSLCMLTTAAGGTCPLDVGTGTQVGVNVFTAAYVPGTADTVNAPSTSAPITITVTPDTVNASVAGTPSTSLVGQSVTLTATLAGVNAPLGTTASPAGLYLPPSGTVVFLNGSTPISCASPATLVASASGVSSTATCTTSALPVGTDAIAVSYAGSLDFLPTTSATPFNETIAPLAAPSFSIAVTPNPASVNVGFGTVLTVTVTGQNGFSEGVNLACGNLPSEMTCVFAPPSVAGGGGTSTLIVETTAPHSCGTTQPYFIGSNGGGGPGRVPLVLPALAGLIALLLPGKRRRLRALTVVLLGAALAQITGCGTCTDLGTKPATYIIQVTGMSTVTGEVGSQAVTVNVTI